MNIPTLLNVSTDWTPIFYLRISTNKKKKSTCSTESKKREKKFYYFKKKKKPFERKLKLIKRNNKIAIGMKYKFNSKSNKSIFAMYLSLHHSSNSSSSLHPAMGLNFLKPTGMEGLSSVITEWFIFFNKATHHTATLVRSYIRNECCFVLVLNRRFSRTSQTRPMFVLKYVRKPLGAQTSESIRETKSATD